MDYKTTIKETEEKIEKLAGEIARAQQELLLLNGEHRLLQKLLVEDKKEEAAH